MTYLGNISLLDQPKHGFLCSQSTKSSVILPCLDWAVAHSQDSTPIMSTFHSEMEAAVLEILADGKCPIILVIGRRPYKKVPKHLQPLLDNGRLLIISVSNQERINRDSAFLANKYICNYSETLTFGFLSPGSSLFPLYEEAKQSGKTVNVISEI